MELLVPMAVHSLLTAMTGVNAHVNVGPGLSAHSVSMVLSTTVEKDQMLLTESDIDLSQGIASRQASVNGPVQADLRGNDSSPGSSGSGTVGSLMINQRSDMNSTLHDILRRSLFSSDFRK